MCINLLLLDILKKLEGEKKHEKKCGDTMKNRYQFPMVCARSKHEKYWSGWKWNIQVSFELLKIIHSSFIYFSFLKIYLNKTFIQNLVKLSYFYFSMPKIQSRKKVCLTLYCNSLLLIFFLRITINLKKSFTFSRYVGKNNKIM